MRNLLRGREAVQNILIYRYIVTTMRLKIMPFWPHGKILSRSGTALLAPARYDYPKSDRLLGQRAAGPLPVHMAF